MLDNDFVGFRTQTVVEVGVFSCDMLYAFSHFFQNKNFLCKSFWLKVYAKFITAQSQSKETLTL